MKPISRRNFIKIGASTLTIPFLECMMNQAMAATASGSLKRVIFYTFHNAWYDDIVFPVQTNYMTGPEGVRYIPLSSISGDISRLFTAAKYGNLKSKMNIMRGFDILSQAQGGGGHRSLYTLGASDEASSSAARDTIDNVIANSSQFYPIAPFKRALNTVPVNNAPGSYNHSYQGGVERSQLGGPTSVFTEYFSGTLPSIGSGTTPMPVEDVNQSRRLAMNAVMNKLSSLSQSTRLSNADKMKLSQHADLINQILPNLAAPTSTPVTPGAGASCSKPTQPTGLNESTTAKTGVTQRFQTLMNEIYMILSCQLTNVVTLQPYNADGNGVMCTDGGANEIYHQLAGHHYDVANYLPAKTWIMDQLLYLLNLMESTTESNGRTMLDNSLVIVLSNDGVHTHSSWDIPVITFGSLGGLIKTGNYINYQRLDAPQQRGGLDLINAPDAQGNYSHIVNYNLGRPLGSLYTTLLSVLGIPHSGFGEYSDSAGNYTAFTTAAAKQARLPIIT